MQDFLEKMPLKDQQLYEQARTHEARGENDEAVKCLRRIVAADAEGQDVVLYELAGILFRAGQYAEALDAFVACHGTGHRSREVEDIVLEAYWQPNVTHFSTLYAENVKCLLDYPGCSLESFPEFEALSHRFIPYSETKYVIFDFKEKTFLNIIDIAEPVTVQEVKENSVVMIKNEYNIGKISHYSRNRMAEKYRDYVTTDVPVYLLFDSPGSFAEFLQISAFHAILPERKYIFLYNLEQVRDFFADKDAVMPSSYLNISSKDDPYYILLEDICPRMLHRPDVNYQNLMTFFSQSFKIGD